MGEDVGGRVEVEGELADLVADVGLAVEDGHGDNLGPDDEEECDVVDPGVDGVEEVVAKLGAVDEGDEEGDEDDGGGRLPALDVVAEQTLVEDGDEGLDEGDGGADAEQGNGEEPDDGEEVGPGHLAGGEGVGEEADGKGADGGLIGRVVGVEPEEADEAGDVLKHGVAERDDERVLHNVGEARAVGRVGGEVAKTDTDGEEDLTAGGLPDLAAAELLAVPLGKVVADTDDGVVKRGGATEQDDEHDNGQTHGEVDGAARERDALEHAEPDAEPDKGGPADRLADHAAARVFSVADDVAGGVDLAGDGVLVGDDVHHVKVVAASVPGQRALEGGAEV